MRQIKTLCAFLSQNRFTTFAECALEHREENFAAHIRFAPFVVGQ